MACDNNNLLITGKEGGIYVDMKDDAVQKTAKTNQYYKDNQFL